MQDSKILVGAHAKINLTLDVTGKRADGYHTVKMVMQTIALQDDVEVTLTNDKQIQMKCNLPYLPTDERNLAVHAAQVFYAETKQYNPGTAIKIWKRIPIAAGLAGGSTDAAAVLRALDTLHETQLGMERLCEMGLQLGADVPYCLRGGTMLAEGIGEILTPLPPMPQCTVVLVKPSFSVSTAEIYAQMRGGDVSPRPDTIGMLQALQAKDYAGVCHRLYNVMEPVTGSQHHEIAEVRDILLTHGADGAVMSGSGPTVFGLFSKHTQAQAAYDSCKKQYQESFLTSI